jgi:hypothetical protein
MSLDRKRLAQSQEIARFPALSIFEKFGTTECTIAIVSLIAYNASTIKATPACIPDMP